MKKIILSLAIGLSFYSCKKEVSTVLENYSYSERRQVLNCENIDIKLYNEAYYAFERAIVLHDQNENKRPNKTITPSFALRGFIARTDRGMDTKDYITEETAKIFETLRKQNIWNQNQLDYSSDIVTCIENEIVNDDFKKTFLALKNVNSLNPKLMAGAIYGNTNARNKYDDRALMVYVALDMFYAKMFAVDFKSIEYLVKKDSQEIKPNLQHPSVSPAAPEVGKAIKLDIKEPVVHGPNDGHNH